MAVLDRSELEASPLADLHAIADQIGLEGFRRLRKADLIDAILGESRGAADSGDDEQAAERPRRRRAPRLRRRGARDEQAEDAGPDEDAGERGATAEEAEEPGAEADADEKPRQSPRARRGRSRGGRAAQGEADGEERIAEGVVEVLGNGSAFLRVEPPEPSDGDVYISAAQVRRCELVSGDRVTGPVRTPRRSERYPSLVRIETINGAPAETVSDGARFDELPVAWPTERIELGSEDKTLEAIEVLVPLGKGSRATIVGGRGAGKSETLRRIFAALRERDGIELSVVLAGARPEEIAEWQQQTPAPAAALGFAASADAQAQAIERTLDAARRVAARGGDAVVLIDSLDGLQPQAARRALAAARNLRDAGSVTVVATAAAAVGGETTVIALDPALAALGGGGPILDLPQSSTLRVELLVGEKDAEAIAKVRAKALKDR